MNIEEVTNMMCEFVAYVDDFYNEKSGIYPIKGMTDMMVIKGSRNTLQMLEWISVLTVWIERK